MKDYFLTLIFLCVALVPCLAVEQLPPAGKFANINKAFQDYNTESGKILGQLDELFVSGAYGKDEFTSQWKNLCDTARSLLDQSVKSVGPLEQLQKSPAHMTWLVRERTQWARIANIGLRYGRVQSTMAESILYVNNANKDVQAKIQYIENWIASHVIAPPDVGTIQDAGELAKIVARCKALAPKMRNLSQLLVNAEKGCREYVSRLNKHDDVYASFVGSAPSTLPSSVYMADCPTFTKHQQAWAKAMVPRLETYRKVMATFIKVVEPVLNKGIMYKFPQPMQKLGYGEIDDYWDRLVIGLDKKSGNREHWRMFSNKYLQLEKEVFRYLQSGLKQLENMEKRQRDTRESLAREKARLEKLQAEEEAQKNKKVAKSMLDAISDQEETIAELEHNLRALEIELESAKKAIEQNKKLLAEYKQKQAEALEKSKKDQ